MTMSDQYHEGLGPRNLTERHRFLLPDSCHSRDSWSLDPRSFVTTNGTNREQDVRRLGNRRRLWPDGLQPPRIQPVEDELSLGGAQLERQLLVGSIALLRGHGAVGGEKALR